MTINVKKQNRIDTKSIGMVERMGDENFIEYVQED